ncbi:MAG: cation diffusion facilitator family transporter, partial [Thermoproteota archaeon]
MSKKGGNRALRAQLASVLLIGSVALLEIAAGMLTNSLAILGDGFHALYDFLVTAMLFVTYRISLKPADENHTYGHSRIRLLGAFAGGIAFLYLALHLFLRGVERILNPSEIYPGSVGFISLGYTLAVDATRITMLSRLSERKEASIKAGILHSLADFLDTLIALSGFLLVDYFRITYADAAAGLLLSIMMVYLGFKLLYETGMELTDTVPPVLVKRIRKVV